MTTVRSFEPANGHRTGQGVITHYSAISVSVSDVILSRAGDMQTCEKLQCAMRRVDAAAAAAVTGDPTTGYETPVDVMFPQSIC